MVDVNLQVPEGLEPRFLQPAGWENGFFERKEGRKIRHGHVFPESGVPDAIVVCLPGLGEFCEKYFETARDSIKQNFGFAVIDWMGQGLSDRYLRNPEKCHSAGHQEDVKDLHELVKIIKRQCKERYGRDIPLVMLGHSMGANRGLHYIVEHEDTFTCAGLSAPMLGLTVFNKLSPVFVKVLRCLFGKTSYVFGGRDWDKSKRFPVNTDDPYSVDPARSSIHNAWCRVNQRLKSGDVTWGWLNRQAESFKILRKSGALESIQTPFLIATAGIEHRLDNEATERVIRRLSNAEHLPLPNSRHESLMEGDETRDTLLATFFALVRKTIQQDTSPDLQPS